MRTVRQWNYSKKPRISLILLDWKVRESFHVLEYLRHQRCQRDDFEVMWIEYYDHYSNELEQIITKSENLGLPSPVDTWVIMERPLDECYHKHKMYNLGILHAQGDIVTIMDSDAMLHTDFISHLIHSFEGKESFAHHIEQVRNFDQSYYPFSYPTVAQMIGEGCVNATKGIPNGFTSQPKSLKDESHLWHIYNYGACFSAFKKDLIRIGGADEHQDYMGHICGPYELTRRLVNAGVPDELDPQHWMYHAWHPNTGGTNNYCGPNDGKGMSTTAMALIQSGRVMPLVENENIKQKRLAMESTHVVQAG